MSKAPIVWMCKPPPDYQELEAEIREAFEINRLQHAKGETKLTRFLDYMNQESGYLYDVLWTDDQIEVRRGFIGG